MVLLYRVHLLEEGKDHNLSISDPIEIEITSDCRPGIIDLHIDPAPITTKRSAQGKSSAASRYLEQSIRFYAITALHKDLSISQTLFHSGGNKQTLRIAPPSWEGPLSNSSATVSREAFMVEDNEDPETEAYSVALSEPVADFVRHQQDHLRSTARKGWTVNYERVAAKLSETEGLQAEDAVKLIQAAKKIIQSTTASDAAPLRTLRDLGQGELDVGNAEDVTAAIEGLSALQLASQSTEELHDDEMGPRPATHLKVDRLTFPASSNIPASDNLAAVHQSVLDDWITPLTDEFSESAIFARERLARHVAAEVFLSSYVLRPEPISKNEPGDDSQERQGESQEPSQSQDMDLPVRPSVAPSSRTVRSVYYEASSQPSSQPQSPGQPSASASTITASSRLSSFTAPEIARLSRYTTISNPPPPLSRSLHKVLSHWVPGTDPATYDWNSTARRFAREDEETAESQLPEKERRRLQRRTERYMRRQRREAEESRRQQVLSSQAPAVVTASQPSQEVGGERSFTLPVVQSSQIAASQVVPGRHGGRKPVKKKRKLGF